MNNTQTVTVDGVVARKGYKFAIMRVAGVELDIYVPPDITRAAGLFSPANLTIDEQRVVSYKQLPDGRLRTTKLGAAGSKLPKPKLVDRADDGSWQIHKLELEALYRVSQLEKPNEDFGTLAEARASVGKVFSPPQTVGKKTNDPTLSRLMRQPKGQVRSPQQRKKSA